MNRRQWGELGLILLLALALRLALFWILPREQLVSDEPEYMAAAHWLAHGRGFSFYNEWPWLRPPVYLVWLTPFIRLFGPSLGPIRLAQVAVSLAVPALTYLLARMMFGRRAAFWAGLITALWAPLAMLPHLLLAENIFLPLLLATFCCLVRFRQEPRPRWLLLGGGLLGLATLAKGLTIGFLPLVGLWVIFQPVSSPPPWPLSRLKRTVPWPWTRLFHAALLAGAALLVILPWSGYNFLLYGRPILADTTGGYNFWLGTQGGQFEHLREVHQTLLEIPDPAARQSYAYRQGFETIQQDPGAYLGGRFTELGQLLRINYSADERLLDGFVLGAVSIPHLLAVFLLEDTLYVLLVPLALLGLLTHKGEAGRGLVLSWLGFNLLVALAFFAINRFRLPLLPFLAIYAAASLAGSPGEQRELRPARLVAAGLLWAAFWIIVLPSYLGPYPASSSATRLGLRGRVTANHLDRAEEHLAAGRLAEAEDALQRALAHRPDGSHSLPTALVVQAELLRAQGNEAAALELFEGMDWYQAFLLRGDIQRAQGDLEGARSQFGAREVDTHNPTDWAWDHLQPPPGQEIDLGSDLDLGLVDGFYLGEHDAGRTFRWSAEQARLRFPRAGTGQPLTLYLSLRGWRPVGERPAEVIVRMERTDLARFTVSSEWEQVRIPLPAVKVGQDVVVVLQANAFLAGPRDLLETGALRFLGVMVERGEVRER